MYYYLNDGATQPFLIENGFSTKQKKLRPEAWDQLPEPGLVAVKARLLRFSPADAVLLDRFESARALGLWLSLHFVCIEWRKRRIHKDGGGLNFSA